MLNMPMFCDNAGSRDQAVEGAELEESGEENDEDDIPMSDSDYDCPHSEAHGLLSAKAKMKKKNKYKKMVILILRYA